MIPGSLTQTTAAIFTLRFLGAVPSTALAQAINHPGRLARSSIALRTTAAEQKHASSEIHLLTTPVLVRLRCNCIRDQLNILFRTQWPLLDPEQHNSPPQSRPSHHAGPLNPLACRTIYVQPSPSCLPTDGLPLASFGLLRGV
jgi:hypothetical protein